MATKTKEMITNLYKYAAVVILFLSIGYLFYQNYFVNDATLVIPNESITLQLENGNIEIINEDGSTKVIDEKGNAVGEQTGNQLVYAKGETKKKLVYHT